MRAAPLVRDVLGAAALLAALLLASPGVRVSRADGDFSYDPALEPGAAPVLELAAAPPAEAQAPSCPAAPAGRAGRTGLPHGTLPLRVPPPAEGEQQSSLNGRGYNIGPANTLRELQVLRFEARRRR